MIWKAGIVQLGIFCERLVRNGVLSNECRGFVYKINRMDPWIEPFCGMPKLSKVGCESLLLMVTVDSTQKHDRIMGSVGWSAK